ncbi:MAG: glycosyltransferase family 2 protein [Candidatus Scalindua sp.]|nr:glycosyltransferase family 2 protein [Candidatus Scalindua sp.]
MKYSVIIPIYNEEDSLLPLYNSLKEVMNKLNEPYEILFVDDGSTDSSLERLKRIYVNSNSLAIVILKERAGKSEALQAGFDNAEGEIYITLDGDGQDNPKEIPFLLNKMDEGFDVVYGWRCRRQDPFIKKVASKIANLIRRLITKEKIHDVGCAMRVFRKKDVEQVCLSKGLHRFFSAIMVKLGYKVGEVEVVHYPRETGISKYGIWDRLVEGTIDSIRFCFLNTHTLMSHERKYQIKEILKT